jgi:hypothetical protein
MIVMITAITPSLNASTRLVPVICSVALDSSDIIPSCTQQHGASPHFAIALAAGDR